MLGDALFNFVVMCHAQNLAKPVLVVKGYLPLIFTFRFLFAYNAKVGEPNWDILIIGVRLKRHG